MIAFGKEIVVLGAVKN